MKAINMETSDPGMSLSKLAAGIGIDPATLTRFYNQQFVKDGNASKQRIGKTPTLLHMDTFGRLGARLNLDIVLVESTPRSDPRVLTTFRHFDPSIGRPDLSGLDWMPQYVRIRDFSTELVKKILEDPGEDHPTHKVTLRQLAGWVGSNHSNLSRFLKGDTSLSLKSIDKLFIKYGIGLIRASGRDPPNGGQSVDQDNTTLFTQHDTQEFHEMSGVVIAIVRLQVAGHAEPVPDSWCSPYGVIFIDAGTGWQVDVTAQSSLGTLPSLPSSIGVGVATTFNNVTFQPPDCAGIYRIAFRPTGRDEHYPVALPATDCARIALQALNDEHYQVVFQILDRYWRAISRLAAKTIKNRPVTIHAVHPPFVPLAATALTNSSMPEATAQDRRPTLHPVSCLDQDSGRVHEDRPSAPNGDVPCYPAEATGQSFGHLWDGRRAA